MRVVINLNYIQSYSTFTKLWQSCNVPLCRVPCFHASRECVEALNRYCGSSLSQVVIHVQALNGIVHNHDNDLLDWLFHWNIFLLRESTSIMSGNGKGFTVEKLFRSPFTEL